MLGGRRRGSKIGNSTFRALDAMIPILENFDFDAKCNLAGFTLVRVAKRQDPEVAANRESKNRGKCRSITR